MVMVVLKIHGRAKSWRFPGARLSCGSLYLLPVPCVAGGEWCSRVMGGLNHKLVTLELLLVIF